MVDQDPSLRTASTLQETAEIITLAFNAFKDLTTDNSCDSLDEINHPAALARLNTLRHAASSLRRGVDRDTVGTWLTINGFGQKHIEYVLEVGSKS